MIEDAAHSHIQDTCLVGARFQSMDNTNGLVWLIPKKQQNVDIA